jgi:succinoglycan biosynthesis protein ExoU
MNLTNTPPSYERAVDVIIAAWNRADTIQRAVSSALAQAEVNRVIVVDDASTDDTASRAEQCGAGSDRVAIHRLSRNCGPSSARNLALRAATAPWIAVLDGDDYFLPGRLRALLSIGADCDFIADDLIHSHGEEVVRGSQQTTLVGVSTVPQKLDLEAFVLGNVTRRGGHRRELGYLKPLMRRDFLERHRLRYDESLRLGEDYAFYVEALAAGARFLLVPAQGYVAVQRAGSLSARHTRADLERLRDFDARLCGRPLPDAERHALRRHYVSIDARVQWLAVIEAFKARDIGRFFKPFLRSPRVSLYLAQQLAREAGARLPINRRS